MELAIVETVVERSVGLHNSFEEGIVTDFAALIEGYMPSRAGEYNILEIVVALRQPGSTDSPVGCPLTGTVVRYYSVVHMSSGFEKASHMMCYPRTYGV